MKKIVIIIGTRPEAIKMAPVYIELAKNSYYDVRICSTGQHKEMVNSALLFFGISIDRVLNISYDIPDLPYLLKEIIFTTSEYLKFEKPDLVLVHGDTSTTLGTALAASYLKIKIGHVEAGLRTNNILDPWPEEINRKLVSCMSSINFCPTIGSLNNLLSEGFSSDSSVITGNTVIDAARIASMKFMEKKRNHEKRQILVTLHRRENQGPIMAGILNAIRQISRKYIDSVEILFPVHPNPNVHGMVYEILGGIENVILTEPLDYGVFINAISNSFLIMTDSGGIQEEAPFFNVPVLILRNTTERPEALEFGVAKLVGTESSNIIAAFDDLFHNPEQYNEMANAINPFGNGYASELIAQEICNKLL